jgi:hypothetical protein
MATNSGPVTYKDYVSSMGSFDYRKFPAWARIESIRDTSEFFYNNLGLSDDFDLSLLKLILEHAKKRMSVIINLNSLAKTILMKAGKGLSQVKLEENLKRFIGQLEKKGYCLVEKEGDHILNFVLIEESFDPNDQTFTEHKGYIDNLNRKYSEILEGMNYGTPFPQLQEAELKLVPGHLIHSFDPIKFGPQEIKDMEYPENSIVQINFPNNSSFHITVNFFTQLDKICILKLKYLLGNMETIREQALALLNKNLKENNKPGLEKKYYDDLIKDYNFKLPLSKEHLNWVRITTILQSIKKKSDEMQDLYHSSFLTTNFLKNEIILAKQDYESKEKKEKEKLEQEKDLEKILLAAKDQKKPFTNRFISGVKDHKEEKTFREKYPEDDYNDLIKFFVDRKATSEKPEIVLFTSDYVNYFIHIENLISYLNGQIDLVPRKFLSAYRLPWSQDIKNNNTDNRSLFEENEFMRLLDKYVTENFPLLKSLLNKPDAIFYAFKKSNRFLQSLAKKWFIDEDIAKLKSLSSILNLSRSYVFTEALHQLSILYWWGPYRRFRAWLRNRNKGGGQQVSGTSEDGQYLEGLPVLQAMDDGSEKEVGRVSTGKVLSGMQNKETVSGKKKADQKSYKDQLKAVKEKAIKLRDALSKEEPPEFLIKEYETIWNVKLRDAAGKETRENVNDAINSYVQKVLLNKVPLDLDYLKELSKKLVKSKNFEKIHNNESKKVDALGKYIQLYIYINFIKSKYKI